MTTRMGMLIGLCLFILAGSPFVGLTSIEDLTPFIFWEIRFPRFLNGFLVGATLATTGCAFQSLFRNPLATPSTTGTTAGASLGALIAIVCLSSTGFLNGYTLMIMAFVGAMAISIPLALLSEHPNIRTGDILLAGIGCTLAMGAISTGLQFTADMSETYRAVQWSLGTLSNVGYDSTLLLSIPTILSTLGILRQSRGLSAMASGEEMAWSQGVNIYKIRRNTLLWAALGVGTCVAQCGPIAFVGLVVPHIIRLALQHSGQIVLWWSPIIGGTFLVLCDGIARILMSGGEIPVGVITAAFGAPMLIGLIWLRRKP